MEDLSDKVANNVTIWVLGHQYTVTLMA
jgi:hypothetical protein